MREVVSLKALNGEVAGNRYIFRRMTDCLIGHAPDCLIQIDDYGVSRIHCLLEIDPPYVWVNDLDSKAGTYINDRRVATSKEALDLAKDGDVIRVGTLRFLVSIECVPDEYVMTLHDIEDGNDTEPLGSP